MINGLDNNQIIALIVNFSILLVSLGVSIFLIFKIKFDDKNYRLLFVIYTLYWIAPMLLREYTSQMQAAMKGIGDASANGVFWWLPVTIYGIIGLFWKPLNDLLSHRLKSRKTVIYISIFIQAAGAIPMIAYPCFATNVIQSLTVGIGASGIAVFSLMFNEQYAKRKVFLTVSLLSLPPLLGEFFSSVLQCCVTSFLPPKPNPVTPEYWSQYIPIVKYMWVIGLFFIVVTGVLTIFIKEKKAFLYQDNQYKEPVKSKYDIWVIVLLIFAAATTSFVKFSTSGGDIITELTNIGQHYGMETKAYEGYLSVIFTVGQMAANIVTGLFLVKRMSKWTIFTISSGLWLLFGILYGSLPNVWSRMAFNILNGWAFGTTYNIIVGMTLNKFFTKSNKITPITLYNTGLSIGICSSLFFKQFLNNNVFHGGKLDWDVYLVRNWIVAGIVIGIILLMWASFTTAWFIEKKHPPGKIRVNRVRNQQDMDD
ncbi:MAG: hypothetical protein ACOQNV_02795 [Mycoplasmoidaceae bacterium]